MQVQARRPRSAALGVLIGLVLQRLCLVVLEDAGVLEWSAALLLGAGAALALVAPLALVSESALEWLEVWIEVQHFAPVARALILRAVDCKPLVQPAQQPEGLLPSCAIVRSISEVPS